MEVVSQSEWMQALEDLRAEEFEGRRQLIVYHFMFAPSVHGWPEAGCPGCSTFVDQIGHPAHFTDRRGAEALGSVWTFLDLTPPGRQEQWQDSPPGRPQGEPYTWWRRHDEYDRSQT